MAKILLGISSSIAVYKMCDLIRELRKRGHQIRVIMTPFSERFIGRLTFEALTGYKVYVDWEEDPFLHINLPRWSDLFLIAPCSVNTLSKIANGICDNLLVTSVLAHKGPLLVAPAANVEMYKNPAVQENIRKLKERGIIVIEPETGPLACEEEGQGRLANQERLLDWIEWAIRPYKPLRGKKALVTVGATREFIDSVRYISNLSSGKMGMAIARVLRWYGADVTLVTAFTTENPPPEVEVLRVVSAEDMRREVLRLLPQTHLLVMNAAVSDFTPLEKHSGKIKKKDQMILKLTKTPDILEEVARSKGNTFVVGFALEEEEVLLQEGKRKLLQKRLDMLVANPIDVMGSEQHRGYILYPEGKEEVFSFPNKLESAEFIVKKIVEKITG
ncbi:phosphopantothenoylcysteine decarboxylase/phosphopantothenate/cysteine ligase [Thermocrinis albus DSM 14484]|uniref:Coenzyme A biosynthesis bifunctional protein CoaBC n=1 Tax=Thermocrinis albus (strain DSM 14484 / JCM 11386 / HI 11/12) TaxID=638303 RepID=D3SMW8_THEAH|nr:bifunctional phosphopantothenoylcysteine decarboxylase/phosphopantothenate--cysteine ligase CoaBC [Thermocrinis albus]ADC90098.1 phosphopantothenoylcysteine decarboxylase/phosphopantothenate/cysteine ligase [Thermocrinis albus DSM 14484]